MPAVRVDVLGPLRLTVGGEIVDVPGPKRGALLAILATAHGRAVPVDDLLEALWAAEPPQSARGSLHSHVSRLRAHLGPAARRLEGLPGAYRLHFEGDASGTDVALVRSLLAAAKPAYPPERFRLLSRARALWRGPALAEFVDVPPLAALAVTLGDLRRTVEEAYASAALAVGAYSEALDTATGLVAQDRFSEEAALLLIRALEALGRPAQALRAGYEFRRRLVTETGLDPSPALGELERSIAARTTPRVAGPSRGPGRLRGRDSELAALHRLLLEERLVTVVGPAGVGKTRLAAEIVARSEHATAVWLGPVTTTGGVPQALADALKLQVVHGDVLSACAALLAPGPRLLLIDNCEHVLAGVREVVATLLDACSQLTVLATSREPLGLAVEQRLRLAPLPLGSRSDLDEVTRSPAVAVFIDRARRVRAEFAPNADDLLLIADIVRRLEGMPLAIELAAGRLSSLGLTDLQARLDRALDLLGEDRMLTLRRTIEWSYGLLPEHVQRLFRHLAVFPDGFDLATAEEIAGDLALPADTARVVAHLVDASMLEPPSGRVPRYRMLEVVRAFGREKLEAEGEAQAATERFIRWALELVGWVDPTSDTEREPLGDRALRRELGNLRSVWALARERGRLDDAVQIVVSLTDPASWRDITEVWGWALELADDPGIDSHPAATTVLGLAAGSAWSRGDLELAEELARRGLGLGGDGTWRCQAALALVALSRGTLASAVTFGADAAAHATRVDQSLGVAALAAAYDGDLHAAAALQRRLDSIAASPTIEGFSAYVAGEIGLLAGHVEGAEANYEHAIDLARQSGATFLEGIASVGLLMVRARTGRVGEALVGYLELIDYWERTGGWVQQWTTLRNLARLLRALGDEETALFLAVAADHAPDAPATRRRPDEVDRYGLSETTAAGTRASARSASRAQVLDRARHAITRLRRTTGDRLDPALRR